MGNHKQFYSISAYAHTHKKNMNYEKIYKALCKRAQERGWTKANAPHYVERHHVVPRCLGGTDAKDNIAVLTAREHFICHMCLAKMHPKNARIIFAANMMFSNPHKGERYTGRRYEWLKKAHSEAQSLYASSQTPWNKGKSNTVQKGVAHSKEHTENIRKALLGKVYSEERRQNISKAKKGVPRCEEAVRKSAEGARNAPRVPKRPCEFCGGLYGRGMTYHQNMCVSKTA